MRPFELERALAYQHLRRWLDRFQDRYDSGGQFIGDWHLASELLTIKSGDAKFATPQELLAAYVLSYIIDIEAAVETGEAAGECNGTTLLECLKAELFTHVEQLAKQTLSAAAETVAVEAPTTLLLRLGRRERQLQKILNEIAALDFDPMAIPDGGKSAIKKICQADLYLFAHTAFDHAWKSGLKLGLFKMENREKFAGR